MISIIVILDFKEKDGLAGISRLIRFCINANKLTLTKITTLRLTIYHRYYAELLIYFFGGFSFISLIKYPVQSWLFNFSVSDVLRIVINNIRKTSDSM